MLLFFGLNCCHSEDTLERKKKSYQNSHLISQVKMFIFIFFLVFLKITKNEKAKFEIEHYCSFYKMEYVLRHTGRVKKVQSRIDVQN